MITITSLRGGVRVKGTDENGMIVSHTFSKKGQKKKFCEVDKNQLNQLRRLGFASHKGEATKPPQRVADENAQDKIIELEAKIKDAQGVAQEARQKAADATQRVDAMQDGNEKEAAKAEADKLVKEADEAGKTYESLKKELAKIPT